MPNEETAIPLSERELQVLQMVVTGASNQEIARHLVISVNTVKVHMRNIFEKLQVQSRTEASLRAIQEGWVAVSDEKGAQAEVAPSPVKTYLVANHQTALLPWQQWYLTGTAVVALVIAILPLLYTRPQNIYVPIIPVGQSNEKALYQSEEEAALPMAPARTSNRWIH